MERIKSFLEASVDAVCFSPLAGIRLVERIDRVISDPKLESFQSPCGD